jgi:hypothetical protein
MQSYGHDIEGSWLIMDAAETLLPAEKLGPWREICTGLLESSTERGFTDRGLKYEIVNGEENGIRAWWPQAEAMLGFAFGWRMTKDTAWLERMRTQWDYILREIVDPRDGSEWINERYPDGTSVGKAIVDEWKCPYHNGRMLLEIIRRLKREESGSEEYTVGTGEVCGRYLVEQEKQEKLLSLKNEPLDEYNGILTRYRNPVLTRDHVPLIWRYDVNPRTNPLFLERLGINAVMNSGAIFHDGKYCLVARIEGNDR